MFLGSLERITHRNTLPICSQTPPPGISGRLRTSRRSQIPKKAVQQCEGVYFEKEMRLLLCYVVSRCEKSFSKSIWMLFTDMFMVWIEKKNKKNPKQKGRGGWGGLGVLNFPKCVFLALKQLFVEKRKTERQKDRKTKRHTNFVLWNWTKMNKDDQR